ncbi:MAG TPA: acylneuraminate cytidylyltransferase family protein [Candidatus Paceibacterota bacterium]
MKKKNLAIIPARSGSKGIPNKNIRIFAGKPLIWHAIYQAHKSNLFDKVIVDTNDREIAEIAIKGGAEVPFLRPAHLATDTAKIADSVELLLHRLDKKFNYKPEIFCLLQTTSPLREVDDIKTCYKEIIKPNVKLLCTICETHPRLYNRDSKGKIYLVNKQNSNSTNRQAWPKGYIENGAMVYMLKTDFFLKHKKFVTKDTVGVIMPRWRSIDLDHVEDWILAETLYKHRSKIKQKFKLFK